MTRLAIDGGEPVRHNLLPYGKQWVSEEDIAQVVEVLRSSWLTTGPKVAEFEQAFAAAVGAREAVAVSSGTAALHAAMFALGIGPGDEVIVPAMTFAASANCVAYMGGTPVFADVDPDTLLIDPAQVVQKITPRTRAVITVDYAGQACEYDELTVIARNHHLPLVDDACHALGGSYKGRNVGSLAHLNTFSLHPVKHITSGEGGVITTVDVDLAGRMRLFRNHGIATDHRQREAAGSWYYEMVELGYNYRLTDFQCALGVAQLQHVDRWISRRRSIARQYDRAFAEVPALRPLLTRPHNVHAYHLYVVQLDLNRLSADRKQVFAALRAEGIGVNVHYVPVHMHPYYRKRFHTGPGQCPIAEAAYERMITLPLFPTMTDHDVEDVVTAVRKVVTAYLVS